MTEVETLRTIGNRSMRDSRGSSKGEVELGGQRVTVRTKFGQIVAASCGAERWVAQERR